MKISDIVTLKIEKELTYSSNVNEMNSTGAIVFIHTLGAGETGTSDEVWVDSNDLEESYLGQTQIERAIDTYIVNGGVSLLIKRLYFVDGVTPTQIIDEVDKAVYGGTGVINVTHIALDNQIKNIQLVSVATLAISISALAEKFLKTSAPEETKILFVTSTVNPTGLIFTPNVFYHFIGSTAATNYFESIAAMAYLSKINYQVDTIKDYEYTLWGDGESNVNLLDSIDNSVVEVGGKVNFFSKTAGLNVLIGGAMTNGDRLLSYYFGLILSHRVSDILTRLTLSKLNFNQTTYTFLYNVLTIELDKFANNGLLDTSFLTSDNKIIFRDNIRYSLVQSGKVLDYGYIVKILPPTQADLTSRNYTGVYILYAIANQIRTLDIKGIVLGGTQ